MSASALGRAAMDLVERAPKPEGYDARLQTEIDRAGWQLRSTEFTTIRIVATVGGLVVLWALTGSFLFGLVGGVLGSSDRRCSCRTPRRAARRGS
jgi:hypothetical protein